MKRTKAIRNKTPRKHRCDRCYNSTPVISENGLRWICTLKTEQAVDCFAGVKDWFISEEMLPLQAAMLYAMKKENDG